MGSEFYQQFFETLALEDPTTILLPPQARKNCVTHERDASRTLEQRFQEWQHGIPCHGLQKPAEALDPWYYYGEWAGEIFAFAREENPDAPKTVAQYERHGLNSLSDDQFSPTADESYSEFQARLRYAIVCVLRGWPLGQYVTADIISTISMRYPYFNRLSSSDCPVCRSEVESCMAQSDCFLYHPCECPGCLSDPSDPQHRFWTVDSSAASFKSINLTSFHENSMTADSQGSLSPSLLPERLQSFPYSNLNWSSGCSFGQDSSQIDLGIGLSGLTLNSGHPRGSNYSGRTPPANHT
ncbi:hypothetical protein M422DRAFT_44153 [Sphaerobolus stellatus SS14]|nr:hypothetical protein M422DRAFT_44153 [Sphaerobolus stellatus SS14]